MMMRTRLKAESSKETAANLAYGSNDFHHSSFGPYRVLSDNMLSDNEGFRCRVSGIKGADTSLMKLH
jgi:hypothetical protein